MKQIPREVFIAKAAELGVPSAAAEQIFDEFDVRGENQVSLADIDDSTGFSFKHKVNYVDTHLLKVNLPLFAWEEEANMSPRFSLGRCHLH